MSAMSIISLIGILAALGVQIGSGISGKVEEDERAARERKYRRDEEEKQKKALKEAKAEYRKQSLLRAMGYDTPGEAPSTYIKGAEPYIPQYQTSDMLSGIASGLLGASQGIAGLDTGKTATNQNQQSKPSINKIDYNTQQSVPTYARRQPTYTRSYWG